MRQAASGRRQFSVFAWILGVLVAGGLLQFGLEVWLGNTAFWRGWVAGSVGNVLSGKVWTLFTYALGHDGPMHLLINGLLIYFIGRALEPLVGQKSILRCFLLSVLAGGLLWFFVHLATGQSILLGASAGALGLLFLFCSLRPNQPMTLLLFFILPVTLKPKWIAFALLAFDAFGLLFGELPRGLGISMGIVSGATAFSAHLGGMLVGFLYARYLQKPVTFKRGGGGGGVKIEAPEWMRRKRSVAAGARYQVNVSSGGSARAQRDIAAAASGATPPSAAQVDRILDKINQEGFGALTPEERQVLDRAGQRFRK